MSATEAVQRKTKELIIDALVKMFPQQADTIELVPVRKRQWLAIYPGEVTGRVKYLDVGALGRVVDSIIPLTVYHNLALVPDLAMRTAFRRAESNI